MELGTQAINNFDRRNLDGVTIPNNKKKPSHKKVQDVKTNESPQNASSADQLCETELLAKKLNHNASERERRKKINYLYSTLRALLPANGYKKKPSIPAIVGQVLKYIPELQKELNVLRQRKDELLFKISLVQMGTNAFIHEEKPKIKGVSNDKQTCSISINKLGDKEIVIQISTVDNISLPEVLLKLEKDRFLILDVSSFLTFGGSTFYDIHLRIEGTNNIIKCEKLNEELSILIQTHNMKKDLRHTYY